MKVPKKDSKTENQLTILDAILPGFLPVVAPIVIKKTVKKTKEDSSEIPLVAKKTSATEKGDGAEAVVHLSVHEGVYGMINLRFIRKTSGSHIYEIPFNIYDGLNSTLTQMTVDEDLCLVKLTTIKGHPSVTLFEESVSEIKKKDISNAVRLAFMSHMAKFLDYGVDIVKNKRIIDVGNHDKDVETNLKKGGHGAILQYKNLDEVVYQGSKGLSNSQLAKEEDREASSAMLMGKALHCLLFTPELFKTQFVKNNNELSAATNEGKFKNLYFELINIGKDILSDKEYRTVIGGKNSFMLHPVAPLLLKEAVFEESFYTMIEDFLFRGRLDCYILSPSKKLIAVLSELGVHVDKEEGILLDLKFTFDNNDNEDQYSSSVIRSGYHRQGSVYSSLLESKFKKKWVFILMTIESKAPHDVTLFCLDDAFLDIGETDVGRLLGIYKAHLDNPDLYKGRNAGVKTLSPPHWYLQKFGSMYNKDK
jgi:hypothetical protein